MHKRLGFTVIEILVAMVIMSILLTVAVVSFRGMQTSARDKERETDIQSIANYLEDVYSRDSMAGTVTINRTGSYPAAETLTNGTYYNTLFNLR